MSQKIKSWRWSRAPVSVLHWFNEPNNWKYVLTLGCVVLAIAIVADMPTRQPEINSINPVIEARNGTSRILLE